MSGGIKYRMRSTHDLENLYTSISQIDLSKNTVVHIYEDKETRSDKQNRLLHLWYKTLGTVTGNGIDHETRYCKLHLGVSIVRAKNPEYNRLYKMAIINLPYNEKIDMMDLWPVTRKPFMDTGMMAEYLDRMEKYAFEKHSMALPQPEDLYFESIGYSRKP